MSGNYPLRPFRISRRDALFQIIAEYPLATLISGIDAQSDISLVPMMVRANNDDQATLVGHVDRNNPQAVRLVPGESVAFVFQGPDAYVSPDIYPDAQLPGWLYVMVKGTGRISRAIEGADAVDMLCNASTRFGGSEQAFSLEKDDPRFDLFINGIVGFEIEISEISGIAKLAQDKGPEHAKLACRYLAESNNAELPDFLSRMSGATG